MKTRAAIHVEHGQPLLLEEIELPPPSPQEVVVRLFATGICHTQLYQMQRPEYARPLLLGHEATGVVIAAGREVPNVKEGDHVMLTWVPRDAGQDWQRPTPAMIGFHDAQLLAPAVFTWAEATIAHHQYVVKLPDDFPTDVTSVIGCAVMTGAGAALNTASVTAGNSVAVFGPGGIGLCIIQACANLGARPLIAVDVSRDKLDFATRFGATTLINANEEDPVERVKEITGGGADFVFDAVGLQKTMEQVLPAVRAGVAGVREGGTAVLVGFPGTTATLNMRDLFSARTYRGSLGGSSRPERDFPLYLQWYREGKLPLDTFVSRRYRFEEINQACDDLDHGRILGRGIVVF